MPSTALTSIPPVGKPKLKEASSKSAPSIKDFRRALVDAKSGAPPGPPPPGTAKPSKKEEEVAKSRPNATSQAPDSPPKNAKDLPTAPLPGPIQVKAVSAVPMTQVSLDPISTTIVAVGTVSTTAHSVASVRGKGALDQVDTTSGFETGARPKTVQSTPAPAALVSPATQSGPEIPAPAPVADQGSPAPQQIDSASPTKDVHIGADARSTLDAMKTDPSVRVEVRQVTSGTPATPPALGTSEARTAHPTEASPSASGAVVAESHPKPISEALGKIDPSSAATDRLPDPASGPHSSPSQASTPGPATPRGETERTPVDATSAKSGVQVTEPAKAAAGPESGSSNEAGGGRSSDGSDVLPEERLLGLNAKKGGHESSALTEVLSTVPVEVSVAPAQATGERPNVSSQKAALVLRQVADHIEMLAAIRPKDGVTIHLHPAELGSIVLTVRSSGTAVEAQISASNDSVRQALSQRQSQLSQALGDRGLTLTRVSVSTASNPTATTSEHGQRHAHSQQSNQRTRHAQAKTVEGVESRPIAGRAAKAFLTSGVDLWI